MKMNSSRLRLIVGFSMLLILSCALVMSGTLAKYKTEMVIANEVDYTNTLAESFKLLDKPVVQQEDGSYKVNEDEEAEPTDGFSYKLIPGVTLPAAPYVEIKSKTEIPAYLYLEVENTGDASLSFDSKWTEIDVTGKKGGTVYVYDNGTALTGGDTDVEEGEEDDTMTIPTFTVDTLSKYPDNLTEGEVKVCAYLLQKVEDTSAADTYSRAPAP